MKILHVVSGMQKASGVTTFVENVSHELIAQGHQVSVATRNQAQQVMMGEFDIVHIHGLWDLWLHRMSLVAHKLGGKVVWSTHGMLPPWAFHYKWWKKLPACWLYQKRDFSKADLIHVTALSEVEDVRRMGLENKIIVASLGVNVDSHAERVERADGKKVLLFVSRVQRKKGLANLIRAWARVRQESSARSTRSTRLNPEEWAVKIVGPDQDNHTAELKQLCLKLGVDGDFEFTGPKYGDDLLREYASADLFVLPTHSENFGSVVIEALAHSVPVITTKGTPWEELETRKCGWWIDIGVEPLAVALKTAMSLSDEERREMGMCGRKLVEEKYTWPAVAKTLEEAYKEIIETSQREPKA